MSGSWGVPRADQKLCPRVAPVFLRRRCNCSDFARSMLLASDGLALGFVCGASMATTLPSLSRSNISLPTPTQNCRCTFSCKTNRGGTTSSTVRGKWNRGISRTEPFAVRKEARIKGMEDDLEKGG